MVKKVEGIFKAVFLHVDIDSPKATINFKTGSQIKYSKLDCFTIILLYRVFSVKHNKQLIYELNPSKRIKND